MIAKALQPNLEDPVSKHLRSECTRLPLGLTVGRPFTPLSVATSARRSATACLSAALSASGRPARASSSPRGRPERVIFSGADMPGTSRIQAAPAQPRQLSPARTFAPRTPTVRKSVVGPSTISATPKDTKAGQPMTPSLQAV